MILYDKITGVHLELTTKCNAMCPMCARNFKGNIRKELQQKDLTLEDCKKILTPEFLKQVTFISLCGVFGDSVCNPELIEIIKYIYSCNSGIFIHLYTNGGIKEIAWWEKLAKILVNGSVVFGIDGIDETHSVYRRNTDINKVFQNANAFIKAGGFAEWDFIVFKHNENQIELAHLLSKKMGFKKFNIKKTSRFFKNLYEDDENLDSKFLEYGKHPVFDNKGVIIDYIELPTNKKYLNQAESYLLEKCKQYGNLLNYYDDVKIDCQAIKTHGIFISAFGDIYPCCTVYQQVCYGSLFGVKDANELNEYNIWKKYDTSALKKSIKEIIDSNCFKEFQNSWNKKSIKAGKPKSCCRTCDINLNMHLLTHK